MKIYHAGRQAGKTHQMVRWAIENDATVIVSTEREKWWILHHYGATQGRLQGLRESQVFTVRSVLDGKMLGHRLKGVGIDNLDMVVQAVFGRVDVAMRDKPSVELSQGFLL